MSARRTPSDPLLKAGDVRTATDALAPRQADFYTLRDDSLLVMPDVSEEEQAAENAQAARHVARRTMRDAHGCTGASCHSMRHGADRGVRDLTLMALGLIEDPGSATVTDLWGRRVRPKPGGDAA